MVVDTKKGVKREMLLMPWDEVALDVIIYINSQGRNNIILSYHFKLFEHFRHQQLIIIPFFPLQSIHKMFAKFQLG